MTASEHRPYVVPLADVTDRFCVRCDCGCGLLTEYATREDAEEAREAAEVET